MNKPIAALSLTMATTVLGGSILSACAEQPSFSISDRPNVVIVTIDTLRADHLGSYGYQRNTSPFIDQLAREGVLFERAISSSSATTPSLASLFTSLEVDQHGVFNNFFDHFPDHYSSLYTMAHMFSEKGYRTIGIASVAFLGYIADGFSEFTIGDRPTGRRPGRAADDPAGKYHYAPADSQREAVTRAMSSIAPDERFFMWLHFYDVHEFDNHHRAYDPEANYAQMFEIRTDVGRHLLVDALYKTSDKIFKRQDQLDVINVYDEKIHFVDRNLRRIYEHIGQKQLNADTLWIISSDHGEGLWHHAIRAHAEEIYNDQLHVPLIFHSKGVSARSRGSRVAHLAKIVDVLPTLAEIIGVPLGQRGTRIQGVSLLPVLNGDEAVGPEYAYSRLPMYHRSWVEKGIVEGTAYTIQNLDHKYILHTHGADEFYDLSADPFESKNLIDQDFAMKEKLETDLRAINGRYVLDYRNHLESAEGGDIAEETLEELRALGYLDDTPAEADPGVP